jgi:S1-C subfamily serine protease
MSNAKLFWALTAVESLVLATSLAVTASTTLAKRVVAPSPPAASVVDIDGQVSGGEVKGTGMVLDSNNDILTNNHVIAGTTSLMIHIAGSSKTYPADVIGVDPTDDVAVLRPKNAPTFPVIPFDTSGSLSLGTAVTAMGNAGGLDGAPIVTKGSITSLDDTIEVADQGDTITEILTGVLCFDAKIEAGDSGGPLLAGGKVIGMDTAGTFGAGTSQSGGCAIPITRALAIAGEILSGQPSPYVESGHRGALGIAVVDLASFPAVQVQRVVAGQAADAAGVKAGDVLLSVQGVVVRSAAGLDQVMKGRRPGDQLAIRWLDISGVQHQATVTLSPGPAA